jgi:hypothetical protein
VHGRIDRECSRDSGEVDASSFRNVASTDNF